VDCAWHRVEPGGRQFAQNSDCAQAKYRPFKLRHRFAAADLAEVATVHGGWAIRQLRGQSGKPVRLG
jgi:hypothetical protein